MSRLHGCVHGGAQVGADGIQIQLVPEADGEVVEGAGGVVAAAVEPAVDDVTATRAHRSEQCRTPRVEPATARSDWLVSGLNTSCRNSTEPR